MRETPDSKLQADAVETPDIRWVKILTEYLQKCDVRLDSCPRILDIGCGNNVKWNYLAITYYLAGHGLGMPHYVGIDQSEEAFEEAKKILGELVEFKAEDAQNLTDFLRQQFQIVLIRHPDIATAPDRPRIWHKIFLETAKVLDPNGCVILTSFWLKDHIPAQALLEKTGLSIVFSGSNKYPGKQFDISSEGEPLRFDKYILIAKKSTLH